MRVFVDTSVWIDFLRGVTPSVGDALAALLDEDRVSIAAPVRIELLSGVRKQSWAKLERLLGAIPTHRPTDATWALLDTWARISTERGHRFGFGDLLIAATATEHGGVVWSLDRDFQRMRSLGFISLHA